MRRQRKKKKGGGGRDEIMGAWYDGRIYSNDTEQDTSCAAMEETDQQVFKLGSKQFSYSVKLLLEARWPCLSYGLYLLAIPPHPTPPPVDTGAPHTKQFHTEDLQTGPQILVTPSPLLASIMPNCLVLNLKRGIVGVNYALPCGTKDLPEVLDRVLQRNRINRIGRYIDKRKLLGIGSHS